MKNRLLWQSRGHSIKFIYGYVHSCKLARESDVSLPNAFTSKNKESTILRYSRVISFPFTSQSETCTIGPSHYVSLSISAPYNRFSLPAPMNFSIAKGSSTDNISVYNDKKQTQKITRRITESHKQYVPCLWRQDVFRAEHGQQHPTESTRLAYFPHNTVAIVLFYMETLYHVSIIENCLINTKWLDSIILTSHVYKVPHSSFSDWFDD